MGLNISPETIQRLRNIEQSDKFKTFTTSTQERLTNLSLQFDEQGIKKFITREDNPFVNPSLANIGKAALLQVPILGSVLAAPTERNINPFGLAGRVQSGLANVQKNILERDLTPIEIREPAGPIDRALTPLRAFGANVADSVGAIGTSFAKGATAPRGAIQSPLGQVEQQKEPISQFISQRARDGLAQGKGIGIVTSTLKATANDIVGALNDLAIDPGLNAIFLGSGKALELGAAKLAGTPIGVQLLKLDRFVKAVEKTDVGKGFFKRFGQNYGDFIDVQFKVGAGQIIKPKAKAPAQIGVTPKQLPGPKATTTPTVKAATPVVGKAKTGMSLSQKKQVIATTANKLNKPASEVIDNMLARIEKDLLDPKKGISKETLNATKKDLLKIKGEIKKPKSALQKDIEKPLTKEQIEEAKGVAAEFTKNLQKDVASAAKRNKRSLKNEIIEQKKALQKNIAESKGGPFEKNVKRRMLIALEDLEKLIAKREGKKLPITKKIKPISSIDTNIKGKGKFKLTDLAGEKPDVPPVKLPKKKPLKISKTDLVRRAQNVLKRFEKLPEGENKKALKGIPARLGEIIKRGKPKEGDLEMIDRFMKIIEREEGAIPKKKFSFGELAKKKPPVKKLTPLEEGIAKPKKKFSLLDATEAPKGKGTGKFTVTNKGKVVGGQHPSLEAAQKVADTFNKNFGGTDFKARELTADELPKPKKVKAAAKTKGKKEVTPLEEGIAGPPAAITPTTKSVASADQLLGKEIVKGKKIPQSVVDATKKFLEMEKKAKALTKLDEKKKIIETAGRKAALQDSQFALEDLRDTIKEDMGVDSDSFAIKIVNKILNLLRDLGEEGSIFPKKGKKRKPIDVGPLFKKLGKKLRAKKIKGLKKGREKAFATELGQSIKTILKAAREEGLTVEEFILANRKAFPNAPKDVSSLQASIKDVLGKVPIDIKKLAVGDIVTEAGQPGIVEAVGGVIKVRFEGGLSEMTQIRAVKNLKQTGRALRLSKIKGKKLPPDVKKIVGKNPEHVRLAELANASIDAAIQNPNDPLVQAQATQMTQRLINAIVGRVVDINNIPAIVEHYAMKSPQFIKMLVSDLRKLATEAGQTLNLLSQNSKQLKKILVANGADPKEVELLFASQPKKSPVFRAWATVWRKINRADQFTKGFLTAAVKTMMRNAEVQGVVSATGFMEDVAVGVYQKLSQTGIAGKEFVSAKAYKNAVRSSFLDVIQFAKNIGKLKFGKNAKQVNRRIIRLLDKFPLDKANLLRAPIQDVFIRSRIIEVLNAGNILQENFFRTMLTQQQAAAFAAKHGTTIHDLAFWRQNSDKVSKFVENALLDTFSSNLKDVKPLGSIVQFFVENPVLASIAGNPFVRFAMNNYFMILGRRSPLQLLNLLGPEFRSALKGPNNAANLKILAQGITGVIAFASAWGVRSSELAGPKWYQIDVTPGNKKDDKFFDTRPFSPLPQYLFMTELAKSFMGTAKSKLTATDFFQGMLSVSRVAGTGLVFVDFLRSEPFKDKQDPQASAEARSRLIKNWFGQYLSRPSVPLKQFQDIIGAFDPAENKYKFIGDNPLLGPTINNIPFVKRTLPDLKEKGRTEARTKGRLAGLVEFGTGLRLQRVNEFEQELARLGLSGMHPGSGNPGINQRIIDEVQPGLAQYGALLMKSPAYVQGTDTQRTDMIKTWVSRAFTVGRENVKIFDERARKFFTRKEMSVLERQVNKEIAGDLLDIYLELSGDAEDEIFSKSTRELLRSGEMFSQPNAK
jgi:hypothetical protein